MSRLDHITCVILLTCCNWATAASGKIIYVDDDAAGHNDGSSWNNGYPHLQDALTDANDSEKPVEIRVAQGVYRPDRSSFHIERARDRSASFRLLDGVALMGGFGGVSVADPNARDIALYETILSGDLAGDDAAVLDPCDLLMEPTRAENSYAVVTAGPCSRSAVLDGFTIRSGNAIGSKSSAGGGLCLQAYSASCCLSIRNCTFVGNSADSGGAAFVLGARPELVNCSFRQNAATWGGAVATSLARVVPPTDCEFVIRGCAFAGNYAVGLGGAMSIGPNPPSIIEDCTFTRNFAETGGAIHVSNGGAVNIARCLFLHNVANEAGGGLYLGWQALNMTSCTSFGNTARTGRVLASLERWYAGMAPSSLTITNMILWDGGDEIGVTEHVEMNVAYSDVQGGWPGSGNMDVDPLFANPGHWDPNGTPGDPNDDVWVEGDYHLKSQAGRWEPASETWVLDEVTSPCIDAGDPNSPVGDEPEPNGGRINMGAYGGTAEASKSCADKP